MRSAVLFYLVVCLSLITNAQKYLVPLSDETSILKKQVSPSIVKLQFSYPGININAIETEQGVFNELTVPNTYKSGKIGEPQLVSTNKIFTIPENATVSVKVNAHTTKLIKVNNYTSNNKLLPLQAPVSKNTNKNHKFQYAKAAYLKDAFADKPIATIKVLGKMRNKQIVKLVVNPVCYNPVKNAVKFYNDIELEIVLSNNESMLPTKSVKFESPYFSEYITKIEPLVAESKYTSNPDLESYPVKYLIVSPNEFVDELQEFIKWKTQKGFTVVLGNMDDIGSNSSNIKTWVHEQYNNTPINEPAPSFLLLVGDINQVPVSQEIGQNTNMETDLYYASVDGDMFPDMYYGRIPAQNEQQLSTMLQKTLYYERYEFTDDAFLNDVTLIAGADGTWNSKVGRPTVNYGTNYYFNSNNGFTNINAYLSSYTGCYNVDKIGVSLINYTAHCTQTSWQNPSLTAATIGSMNNNGKYGIAIGNCCTSGDFSINECIGEAFVRNPNGGAVAYIGSVPDTYWKEDFYWAVGAHSPVYGQYPDSSQSSLGVYDAPFVSNYNTVDAMVFVGNLSVTEAHNEGYDSDVSSLYYWEAYHCLGDPSVTPYLKQGLDNKVEHDSVYNFGIETMQVKAAPGSLVALSNRNGLIATAKSDADSIAILKTDTLTLIDTVKLVVTKANYKPYMKRIPIGVVEGTFLVFKNLQYVDTVSNGNGKLDYNENGHFNISLKNIGDQTAENILVSITSNSNYIQSFSNNIKIPVSNISSEDTATITGAFNIRLKDSVPDLKKITFNIEFSDSTAGNTRESYSNTYSETLHAPKLSIIDYFLIDDFTGNGNNNLDYGEVASLIFAVTNKGTANATINADLLNISKESIIQIEEASLSSQILEINDTVFLSFKIAMPGIINAKVSDTLSLEINDGKYTDEKIFNVIIGQDLFSQLGDESNTAIKYPFYNYYKSNSTQLLFLNNEFGYGVKAVKSISLNINRFTESVEYRDLKNFKIDAGFTSNNELITGDSLKDKQTVFYRPVFILPDSTGWLKFKFDTTLLLDQEKNIILELTWGANDNFTTESTSTTVKSSVTTFKSVAWGASDNNHPAPWEGTSVYRPNVQIEFDSVGIINTEVKGDMPINNKLSIENCSVTINNKSEFTDNFGRTKHYFLEYDGEYTVGFNAYGYHDSVVTINKTSTYEHINMQLKRKPELHIYLTNTYNIPIENVEISINGMIHTSDGNGELYCYNNTLNNHSSLLITNDSYMPFSDSVFINSIENSIHIMLEDKFSGLTIEAVNSKGQAIENVQVIINGEVKTTGSLGTVEYNKLLKAEHTIQLYHNNYLYKVDTVNIEKDNDSVRFILNAQCNLSLNLFAEGTKLSSELFTLNNTVFTTNNAGTYYFKNLTEGEYIVCINEGEYYSYIDTVILFTTDTVLNINLKPKADLTFFVHNANSCVVDAVIQLVDTTYLTDSLGIICIKNLSEKNYSYVINKKGYYSVSGSLYVGLKDTIVNIYLLAKPDIQFILQGVESEVTNVAVNFNGSIYYPGVDSKVHINDLDSGIYNYSISHNGYYQHQDSIIVKDTNLIIPIELRQIPDVKFSVSDGSKQIQGANIVLNNEKKLSDAVGEYCFTDVHEGIYTFLVSKAGYERFERTISLKNNDTLIKVELQKFASLKFIVSAAGNLVQNANIKVDSTTYNCNSEGEVFLESIMPGKHTYLVSYRGYDIVTDTLEILYKNTIEYVNLFQSTYNLSLFVTGGGNVIENAQVELDGIKKRTDSSGLVNYYDLPGNAYYQINILKENFIAYYDSIYILDRNLNKNVDIEPILHEVAFVVNDANGFLEGANITFDNKVKQTNELGKAVFFEVSPDTNKTFYVRKIGTHYADTGHLNLYCDTVLNINLLIIPVVGVNNKIWSIQMYPNPTKGQLFIVIEDEVLNSKYQIHNAAGAIVKQGELKNTTTKLTLNKFHKGMYFISFIVNDRKVTQSIIIE